MEDFSPMIFVVFLFFALLFLLTGIVLLLIASLIISALIFAGILSISVIAGLYKRSFSVAFKTGMYSVFTIGGMMAGITLLYFLNRILHWWTRPFSVLFGAFCGGAGGFLTGMIAIYLLKKLYLILKKKFSTPAE